MRRTRTSGKRQVYLELRAIQQGIKKDLAMLKSPGPYGSGGLERITNSLIDYNKRIGVAIRHLRSIETADDVETEDD